MIPIELELQVAMSHSPWPQRILLFSLKRSLGAGERAQHWLLFYLALFCFSYLLLRGLRVEREDSFQGCRDTSSTNWPKQDWFLQKRA